MNVLVFDTETSNINHSDYFSINGNMILNIGGVIIDVERQEIIEEFDYLIEEIWENEEIMNNFYFKDRLDKFQDITEVTFSDAIKNIKNLLQKYNVNTVLAYNISFDQQSLLDTCDYMHMYIDLSKYEIKDIYAMACDMLKRNKEAYSVFCTETGRLSPAGNRLTNAESVYAFLTGNPDYAEDHTALEDSRIEAVIFLECQNYEDKYNITLESKPNRQCWRWAQG